MRIKNDPRTTSARTNLYLGEVGWNDTDGTVIGFATKIRLLRRA